MTDSEQHQSPIREAVLVALRDALQSAASPLEHILAAARLDACGDATAIAGWPKVVPERFGPEATADLVDSIRTACLELVPGLRHGRSTDLAKALLRAQSFNALLHADRSAGALLAPAHHWIEAMLLECHELPLDDDAADELSCSHELAHNDQDRLIPLLVAPVGLTGMIALGAAVEASEPIAVKQVRPVEQLEPELAFDGGRPSPRMIERFSARRGIMVFDDETTAEVRAILEPDWQVSIQFDGEPERLQAIDKVRLGTRMADPTDESRDFWRTSLAQLGVDTQSLLVNQPIMVRMRNGERFTL